MLEQGTKRTFAGPTLNVTALIADVENLLETEIFSTQESCGPLFRAAFVWLILNVNELLQEADRRGKRIVLVDEGVEDVTDLIARARYVIVHKAGGAKRGRMSGIAPEGGNRILVGEFCGHPDDIALDLGGVRILIRRDAVRAFEAVKSVLVV